MVFRSTAGLEASLLMIRRLSISTRVRLAPRPRMSTRAWPEMNRVDEVFWALEFAATIGISIRASPRTTWPDTRIWSALTVASGRGASKVSRRMREPVTTISSTFTPWPPLACCACARPGAQNPVAATEHSIAARNALFLKFIGFIPRSPKQRRPAVFPPRRDPSEAVTLRLCRQHPRAILLRVGSIPEAFRSEPRSASHTLRRLGKIFPCAVVFSYFSVRKAAPSASTVSGVVAQEHMKRTVPSRKR
jgi:hypothetical protein